MASKQEYGLNNRQLYHFHLTLSKELHGVVLKINSELPLKWSFRLARCGMFKACCYRKTLRPGWSWWFCPKVFFIPIVNLQNQTFTPFILAFTVTGRRNEWVSVITPYQSLSHQPLLKSSSQKYFLTCYEKPQSFISSWYKELTI